MRVARRHLRRRRSRRFWLATLALAAIVVAAGLVWQQQRARPDPAVLLSDRQQRVAAASAALRADPNVADLVYSPRADQWDVTPAMASADATAFARYICFVLDTHRVTHPTTSVRVIDNEALDASGFDYNQASRGRLTCGTETQ